MNIANIDKAIAVMERAKNLDMGTWQSYKTKTSNKEANSIEELHKCGNTACFAGYIAISEEFKADGGGTGINDSYPVFNGETADDAIALWLETYPRIADWFVYGIISNYGDDDLHNPLFSLFYQKEWSKVESSDVIEKLKELKKLGQDAFFEKYEGLLTD